MAERGFLSAVPLLKERCSEISFGLLLTPSQQSEQTPSEQKLGDHHGNGRSSVHRRGFN